MSWPVNELHSKDILLPLQPHKPLLNFCEHGMTNPSQVKELPAVLSQENISRWLTKAQLAISKLYLCESTFHYWVDLAKPQSLWNALPLWFLLKPCKLVITWYQQTKWRFWQWPWVTEGTGAQSVRSLQTFITSQMCVSSFPAGTTQGRLKCKTSLNFSGVLRCVIKVQPESGAVESQHINTCRSKGNYCVLHGDVYVYVHVFVHVCVISKPHTSGICKKSCFSC